MGYYINNLKDGTGIPPKFKAQFILDNVEGSKRLTGEIEFQENLVCVAENGPFDAAAHAYSEEEMGYFLQPDGRRKTWLIVPNAASLSGYNEN